MKTCSFFSVSKGLQCRGNLHHQQQVELNIEELCNKKLQGDECIGGRDELPGVQEASVQWSPGNPAMYWQGQVYQGVP